MNCLSIFGATLLAFACINATASPQTPPIPTESNYTLTGTITGMETGWVYLQHIQTEKIDSVKTSAGKFIFSGVVGDPEYCRLGIMGKTRREFRVGFFLEKGTLKLEANKESMDEAVVSGTPVQDEYRQFSEKIKAAIDWGSYNKAFTAAGEKKDTVQTDSLRKAAKEMGGREQQLVKEYVKTHPSSYVSVLEIEYYFSYDPDAAVLGELYNGLDEHIRTSYTGKTVKATLDAAIKTAVGQAAPDFAQTDVRGKSIALSSFKGQYVLIDFWASWCGPCREENPAVVRAWQRFHSKGFAILGVSLDEQKDKWLEAIKKDELKWMQVSDLKGWKNSAALLYGVSGIPMNFLLDKNGKIIAKGLRGEDLENKLAELAY
jgi:peroxiredoxin